MDADLLLLGRGNAMVGARAQRATRTVQDNCLVSALDRADTVGVWTGTSAHGRQAIPGDAPGGESGPEGQLFDHLGGLLLDGQEQVDQFGLRGCRQRLGGDRHPDRLD